MSCFYVTTLLVIALHLCFQASYCVSKQQSSLSASSQGVLIEDKTRLGSTPPSCHNRCNQCHPCMAVQVPTTPIREPGQPESKDRYVPLKKNEEDETTTPSVASYTNYKPLGWKCRCNNHFFNP